MSVPLTVRTDPLDTESKGERHGVERNRYSKSHTLSTKDSKEGKRKN